MFLWAFFWQGFDMEGAKEFVEGGYWAGELYVDPERKSYKALDLKAVSVLGAFYQYTFNPKLKKLLSESHSVGGNLSGDGM